MEKSIKSLATNWGLYLGVALALLTVLGYVNLDLFTKWWFGIGMLILVIVMGIISAMKSKGLLGGFISFKNAFTSYFITVALGLVISTVVSIIIFNFVDPEAANTLKEKIMDSQVQMMQNFGAPEEAIAEAVEKLEAQENMFSIGKVLQSLAFQLIGYSIVGLIVALVVKKNNPDEA
ncbi:DUF4199 domain-containing protein [Sabulilitoribacter multivorans]|uniref:DUF4199 domain-containing protein n=1 Tax=Flaviramulus multivorans TaxID=1304750 RepID=A0ABS9ILB6_9FLAO|nr:DUF4199 domain-containing protein [Flaviramulus multivorans]MCF7561365.1 DUF4199 domain-containing protein [Flaviramulus multivorans]